MALTVSAELFNSMKKCFTFLFLALALFAFVEPASADFRSALDQQLEATAGAQGANFGQAVDPRFVAALLIKRVLTLLGTLFLAMTVYAGFVWATSAGESDKIEEAKKTIRRSVIGIIVVLSAYSITAFLATLVDVNERTPGEFDNSVEEPFDIRRANDPFAR